MQPHDRYQPGTPSRRARAAGAAVLMALATTAAAGDYMNKKEVPDQVLRRNIERLAQHVMSKELNEPKLSFRVTRMLGREALDSGKQRVWFCIEGDLNGKKSNGCGGDNILVPLDTGRWILQDVKRGSWLIVEE